MKGPSARPGRTAESGRGQRFSSARFANDEETQREVWPLFGSSAHTRGTTHAAPRRHRASAVHPRTRKTTSSPSPTTATAPVHPRARGNGSLRDVDGLSRRVIRAHAATTTTRPCHRTTDSGSSAHAGATQPACGGPPEGSVSSARTRERPALVGSAALSARRRERLYSRRSGRRW